MNLYEGAGTADDDSIRQDKPSLTKILFNCVLNIVSIVLILITFTLQRDFVMESYIKIPTADQYYYKQKFGDINSSIIYN